MLNNILNVDYDTISDGSVTNFFNIVTVFSKIDLWYLIEVDFNQSCIKPF